MAASSPQRIGSLGVSLHDQNGARLVSVDTKSLGLVTRLPQGRTVVSLRIESLHLTPGIYQVALWATGRLGRRIFDRLDAAFSLQIIDPSTRPNGGQSGSVTCRFQILDQPAENGDGAV